MMRRLLGSTVTACVLVLCVVYALTGCTRAQIRAWVVWHETDPVAAEQFANLPHIQDALHANASSDAPQFREYLTNRHDATWDRIAWCESGGQWNHRPVTNSHGTFSGGLMIWSKAWVVYGGGEFASQAWQATRGEQIAVAERILADRGWQAWDCA